VLLVLLVLLAGPIRHPNDELNYCYYLIPCGKAGYCGDVQESDLARLHNDAITKVGSAADGDARECTAASMLQTDCIEVQLAS